MSSKTRQYKVGVLLIGLRGAGKSTIGPLLAERLGMPFLDADAAIEAAEEQSVAELMAAGRFRAAEERVLGAILTKKGRVVAAGGGCVLWKGLTKAARDWRVVWLDAAPERLAERLAADAHPRPSLTGHDVHEEVAEVSLERRPLYRKVAEVRVDTSDRKPEQLAAEIARILLQEQPSESRCRE